MAARTATAEPLLRAQVCQEAGAVTVKNTSSKTGANIAELFDDVVNEVTDRFQGPPSSRLPPLTKPARSSEARLLSAVIG